MLVLLRFHFLPCGLSSSRKSDWILVCWKNVMHCTSCKSLLDHSTWTNSNFTSMTFIHSDNIWASIRAVSIWYCEFVPKRCWVFKILRIWIWKAPSLTAFWIHTNTYLTIDPSSLHTLTLLTSNALISPVSGQSIHRAPCPLNFYKDHFPR